MSTSTSPLSRSDNQRARAKALEVFCHANGTIDIGDFDPGAAAAQLLTSPADFCRQMHDSGKEPRIVRWRWPEDLRREVMLPPNHFLLVAATDHFVAKLILKNRVIRYERSLEGNAGYHFVLLSPPATPLKSTRLTLELTVFEKNATRRGRAFIKSLPMGDNAVYQLRFSRRDLASTARTYLNTNRLGAMIHTPIRWGELNSRYDALLAANQNSEFPTDRLIMFTRCRGWIVHQDYSEEICADRLVGFETDIEGGGHWRFQIPTGRGQHVVITISLDMDPFENITHLRIHRHSAANRQGRLADSRPIRLILRPDIENRDFHGVTKAYMGAEHHFPRSTTGFENRFEFTPDADRRLNIGISSGDFIVEPEWQYMIFRPVEADRGLDPQSDLFSPGYFAVSMTGDDRVTMTAQVRCAGCGVSPTAAKGKSASLRVRPDTPASHLERSMNAYLVRRGDMKSVIAGYPWFLDWGRDALIFVRGLIAAGRTADARDVLVQFGQFEEAGTLPNMIHGQDARNRDTSDAPLWFITCCGELIRTEGKRDFLDASCGSRCIRDILLSIANAYANGTPNGVRMDHATGLIFSPSHFTWMDTNYPAGTPRQGYPIEIQALWFAALSFLSEEAVLKSPAVWADLAKKTAESIRRLFFLSEKGFLSDCLHGGTTTPAADARPDDALRPNQLLAVTLGAVRDPAVSGSILDACSTLLVPGAIRSLADQPVTYPVDILIDDRRLVDPLRPYQGRYAGDEDTKRKPAYHNGTAWTWMFPSFCEAWAITYGKAARDTALSWLSSSFDLINSGCVGHVPEILDGDYPHAQRGCDAQAWGESELLRVWRFLKKE